MIAIRTILATAVAAAAMLVSTASAQATTANVDCAVEGNLNAWVSLVGGIGTYHFSPDMTCAVAWANGATDTVDLDFNSDGTFNNTICGTMQLGDSDPWGSVSSQRGDAGIENAIGSSNLGYQVSFSHFLGMLTFTGGPTGSGLLHATPNSPTTTQCTATGFAVRGAISFTVDGAAPPPNVPNPGGLLAPTPEPPTYYPSSTCRVQGGSSAIGDGEHFSGSAHVWAHVWRATATTTYVCVRAQSASGSFGGRLQIDTGSPAVPYVDPTHTDSAPCTQEIHHSDALGSTISRSPGTSPLSLCVTVAGSTRRIEVGTAGGGSLPNAQWQPDPDNVRPDAKDAGRPDPPRGGSATRLRSS